MTLYQQGTPQENHLYAQSKIDMFRHFLTSNHGLSRYDKIRFFYDEILKTPINEKKLNQQAALYSEIVLDDILSASYIPGAVEFLKKNCSRVNFLLISSSDERELCTICRQRDLSKFFIKISGSPTKKTTNIENAITDLDLNRDKTVYIGDAISDMESSNSAKINFIGFGKENFSMAHGIPTVNTFDQLQRLLFIQ